MHSPQLRNGRSYSNFLRAESRYKLFRILLHGQMCPFSTMYFCTESLIYVTIQLIDIYCILCITIQYCLVVLFCFGFVFSQMAPALSHRVLLWLTPLFEAPSSLWFFVFFPLLSSSSLLPPSSIHLSFSTVLLSDTTRRCRLSLYFPFPGPRISHSSKFLLDKNIRNQSSAREHWDIVASRPSQLTK